MSAVVQESLSNANAPPSHGIADLTRKDIDLSAPLENPFYLSLHGLSKASARVALHMVRSTPTRLQRTVLHILYTRHSAHTAHMIRDVAHILPAFAVHGHGQRS